MKAPIETAPEKTEDTSTAKEPTEAPKEHEQVDATKQRTQDPPVFANLEELGLIPIKDDGPAIGEPPSQEHPPPSFEANANAKKHTLDTESYDAIETEEPAEPLEIQEGLFGLVELLLKDRNQLFQKLRERDGLAQVLPGLLAIALVCSSIVGGILGTYTGGWQILYVGLKLPLLLLLTLVVCYAAFWMWGLYFRTQINADQVAALTLASIATTALLLLGLSPFLWLGLSGGVTEMKVMNLSLIQQEAQYHRAIMALVICFGVASVGGIRVLYKGIRAVAHDASESRLGGTRLLAGVWIGLYAFVGLQMAWILRPYLFHPWAKGRPLTFVRSLDGSVFESVAKILLSVLGWGQ